MTMKTTSILPVFPVLLSVFAGCAVPADSDAATKAVSSLQCLNCDNEPGDPSDPKPKPQPLTVSPPDFSIQTKLCLPDKAVKALTAAIKKKMPSADVRTVTPCNVAKGTQIGIYVLQPTVLDPAEARDKGVAQVALLQENETVAMNLSRGSFEKSVSREWATIPRAYDSAGKANAAGPVFLTGYSLGFVPGFGTRGVTSITIDGNVDRSFGMDFHAHVNDTVELLSGKVSCSNESYVDVDKTWLDVLLGITFVTIPVLTPPLVDIEHLIDQYSASAAGMIPDDVKCGLASAIPNAIPLSEIPFKGDKADFSYSRLTVTPGRGIDVGGMWKIVPRTPKVSITGGKHTLYTDEDFASSAYKIRPFDMVPPLKVTWTFDGTSHTGSGITSMLKFHAPNGHSSHPVKVHVVDADGLTADATTSVSVWHTINGGPLICDKKPYLPQCKDL